MLNNHVIKINRLVLYEYVSFLIIVLLYLDQYLDDSKKYFEIEWLIVDDLVQVNKSENEFS